MMGSVKGVASLAKENNTSLESASASDGCANPLVGDLRRCSLVSERDQGIRTALVSNVSVENIERHDGVNEVDELTKKIAMAAKDVDFEEAFGIPFPMEFSGYPVKPCKLLVSASEKILDHLYKVAEIERSHYWESIVPEYREIQRDLCADFVERKQSIQGRVRIDSVISEIDGEGNSIACPVEYEAHCGADLFTHVFQNIVKEAGVPTESILKVFSDHVKEHCSDSKVRFVQWPDEERSDISYKAMVGQWIDALKGHGVDGAQYDYADPQADWEGALVYRLFEFSELGDSNDQQAMVKKEREGLFSFANPAFAFGKLIPLFVTEFSGEFKSRLGLSDEELAIFPKSWSATFYLSNSKLQSLYPPHTLYLKGVLSKGSGGSNDVYPLRNFSSPEEALAFIKEKNDDGRGGWIVQTEVRRAKISLKQCQAGDDRLIVNKGAGILQRQTYFNGKYKMGYNVGSSRDKSDDTIHNEAGSALIPMSE